MKVLGATVLGIGLLTACSTAQMSLCDGASQNGTGSSSYSLGSGDRVQVVVFRQSDLSGEFSLDREGYLALPLVGEIAASHLTTRQLEDEIESRLKAGSFPGRCAARYLSSVLHPGRGRYPRQLRVSEWHHGHHRRRLAGGYTARADRSSVTIGRGHCRFATQADTFVNPGDIITVAERFF